MKNKKRAKNIIEKIIKHYYLIIVFFIWVFFASPYLFFGKTPYPSTYQVNNFAPASVYPGFGGPVKNNAQPDIITQIYPWRFLAIQEYKNGSIPFWNPYSFGGTPLLANYQSAALFPLNLLFFLPLPFIDIWGLLVVLQPLLAALFIFIFMRSYNTSKEASLISSISFMFCGFLVTWLGYSTLGYAILILPLALFAINKYQQTLKSRWMMLLSLTIPFSFFAGHFQTSIYFLLTVVAYAIFNILLTKNKRKLIIIFLYILIGMLLSMPQIIPSLEFYTLSFRSGLFLKVEAIPSNYLITLFSPDFFGNPVTRNDWYGHYAEWNGYAGVIPLMLAFFAALFKRSRYVVFFLLTAIFALIFALDTPILDQIVKLKIPVISTSAASRIMVLFSFSIAVLAGFGFDTLKDYSKKIKPILIWIAVIFVIFLTSFILGYIAIKDLSDSKNFAVAIKNSILPVLLILSVVISNSLKIFIKRKRVSLFLSSLIVFLIIFEMFRFAQKWQNFDPKELVYRKVPIVNYYSVQNKYDRFVGLSGGEDAVYYKIPVLSGYDPLFISEYGKFMKFVEFGKTQNPDRSVVSFPYKGAYTAQALNYLGVKYIVHKTSDGTFPWAFPFSDYPNTQFSKEYDDSHYQVFKNNNAFGRVFLVNDIKVIDQDKILNHLFTSDLSKVAFVNSNVDFRSNYSSGSAKIIDYKPNYIKVEVNSYKDSFLVITDNFYPGWRAKINDAESKIYKTNFTFRGIKVPQGRSIVELFYLPFSFLIGVYLFLIGILGLVSLYVIGYIKEQKWN